MNLYPLKCAGVDWITVTSADKDKAELLRDHSYNWLSVEADSGNKIRPWSMSGFSGFHCGAVSFGELDGTWLLRLASNQAYEHWRTAFELSTNCSRIDVQTTISDVAKPASLIQQHFKEAKRFFKTWRKPPAVNLFKSNDGSCTLYLNRRVSDQFGRIYDKAIESKLQDYEGCLRYEVEFKNDLAYLVAKSLFASQDTGCSSSGRVSRFFRERGIRCRHLEEAVTPISVPKPASDDVRSLQWLSKSVRPVVRELVSRGRLLDVLASLNLPTFPDGISRHDIPDGPT